ncbi:uncharacterized protein LOC111025548 [Momordica charantia]|uniref:Uncharacterized protein LOC111025548 n=1 Tax=Momordica charantia TaxID=3673 RepID=A0A6J1E1E7_MOMCH|nr:uncharacterized protein LOC111025548 [Momordica charantia]
MSSTEGPSLVERRRTRIFDSQKIKKQHKSLAPNGSKNDHDNRNSEPISLNKGKPIDRPESSEKRHNQKEKGFDLEELLGQADSPFTEEIMREKVPPKFKLPTVKPFDGMTEPVDHLDAYREWMDIYGVSDAIRCRVFSTTLNGSARIWFRQLKRGSISSFKSLARAFMTQFVGGRCRSRPVAYLLTIKQRTAESLHDYVARFNEEKLQLEGLTDAVSLLAFMSGVRDEHLSFSFEKRTPSTFSEALSRAQRYMSASEFCYSKREPDGKRTDQKRERSGDKPQGSRWEKRDRGSQKDPPRKF